MKPYTANKKFGTTYDNLEEYRMNETMNKRQKLVQKRIELQKMVQEINKDIIRNCTDEITKGTAMDLRDELIIADNILNGFELRFM